MQPAMKKIILSVDDAATKRKVVAWALIGAGHEVIEAEDRVAVLDNLRKRQSILKKIGNYPRPGGSHFLGSSEPTLNLDPHWAPVTQGSTVVYRPAAAAVPALVKLPLS